MKSLRILGLAGLVLLWSCAGARVATVRGQAEQLHGEAIASAAVGRTDAAVARLRDAFRAGLPDPERVLADARLAAIREHPEPRRLLSAALRACVGASEVTMVTDREPGDPMVVRGLVRDRRRAAPVAGAVIYLFHTDDRGHYAPEHSRPGHGANNPRLFGYVRSDPRGEFVVRTIRPASYPGMRNMRHVHFTVHAPGYRPVNSQFYVDGDPSADEERRRIAADRGWPILVPEVDRDGVHDVRLTIELAPAADAVRER